MAVNDHRVFSHEGEWWAAVVSGAAGAGAGPHLRRQIETVLFTSVSDGEKESLANSISPGSLNNLSHAAITTLLEDAAPYGHRANASGYNIPDRDDYREQQILEDDEGLEWGIKATRVVRQGDEGSRLVPAVQLQCLHDSALRQVILQQDEMSLRDARAFGAEDVDQALITAVKNSFDDLDD